MIGHSMAVNYNSQSWSLPDLRLSKEITSWKSSLSILLLLLLNNWTLKYTRHWNLKEKQLVINKLKKGLVPVLCSLGYYPLVPGVTLGIFGWGCAAGTLEPLAYTSIEPIYGSIHYWLQRLKSIKRNNLRTGQWMNCGDLSNQSNIPHLLALA